MIKNKKLKKVPFLQNDRVPYRNRSLKNLKGEKWAPVPGFEESYQISNYGRIKSLAREIQYGNGRIIRKKERIKLAGVSPAPNYIAGDYSFQLGAHCNEKGKVYHFSVARLVYHCFVKYLPDNETLIYIVQKDGNGLNCHYKNLLAVTPTEKEKRMYAQNRTTSPFRWLDMTESRIKATAANYEPVTQYDREGKRIGFYESIAAASKATGINASSISAMIRGISWTAGNFIWKRGKTKARISVDGHFNGWRATFKESRGKKVTQYSLEQKAISTYPSISDAAKETGISPIHISRVMRGKAKTAGGFIWRLKKHKSRL